jgi:hypothetical protein
MGKAQTPVELEFMVVPEQLAYWGHVPDAAVIRIVQPDHPWMQAILGASGKKLARAGVEFYFRREKAEELVKAGIAAWV